MAAERAKDCRCVRSFLSLSLSLIMKVCDAGVGGGGGVWCGAVMKI